MFLIQNLSKEFGVQKFEVQKTNAEPFSNLIKLLNLSNSKFSNRCNLDLAMSN